MSTQYMEIGNHSEHREKKKSKRPKINPTAILKKMCAIIFAIQSSYKVETR